MIVVDTNILVYLALPEPQSPAAEELACRDPQWAAPLLWRYEFGNVLAGHMRRRGLSLTAAEIAMQIAIDALEAGEHTTNYRAVLELVAASNCTAYDCEFAALAMSLDTVLVTEDRALQNAFPKFCLSLNAALAAL